MFTRQDNVNYPKARYLNYLCQSMGCMLSKTIHLAITMYRVLTLQDVTDCRAACRNVFYHHKLGPRHERY